MKTVDTLAMLLAGFIFTLGLPACTEEHESKKEAEHKEAKQEDESKEKAAFAASAKVTIDQAIKTATDKVQGKVIEAELEKEDEKLVWEVEIVGADGKVSELYVDADTGALVPAGEKEAEETTAEEKKSDTKPAATKPDAKPEKKGTGK
jgi:hypothetical protein